MNKAQLSVLVAILSFFLLTLTHSAAVPDAVSSRSKRQSADVRTAEYLAWIALGGKVPSRGCDRVACGVVDVYSSGKKKRTPQLAEVSEAERYNLLKSLLQRAALESSSS
ncbi:uncharacterized protein LOC106011723 [Aplysia californica]|uniref:Uncharacterized protein LOC106011723 n=1 Tax=Aplysia californica TaxID=6500 RepID=A0ABM0ZZK0_APLCA|nr:uncharacterized protein LOC106011723 [Aplysia californica]